MEANELNEGYRNDEIDLYDLWVILKKRKITVFLVMLICLGVAIAYVTLTPKIYRVSNTLMLDQPEEIISKGQVIAIIRELDESLELHKDETSRLNVQVKELNLIKNIQASEIKGADCVRVDIETLDRRAGIELMEALPGYIQSSSIVAIKLNMRKNITEKNIADLKRIIDNPTREIKLSSKSVLFMSSADLYTLREKYNHLMMMQDKLQENKIVRLTSKTQPPDRQYKPKRQMIVLTGLLVGCFLGILVAFILEWSSSKRYVRGLE